VTRDNYRASNLRDLRDHSDILAAIDRAVELAKSEIRADVARWAAVADALPRNRDGRVRTWPIREFGDLHDWVDANCYGGLCDDDEPWCPDEATEPRHGLWQVAANEVQERLNDWIRGGGHLRAADPEPAPAWRPSDGAP